MKKKSGFKIGDLTKIVSQAVKPDRLVEVEHIDSSVKKSFNN